MTDPEELALLRSLYHSAAEGTDADGEGGMASNASPSSSSESESADADAAAAPDVVQVGIYLVSAH